MIFGSSLICIFLYVGIPQKVTSVILTKEHEFLRETVKKKIFIQVKDFNAHGFVTSSTENGYSNFETVKISEESNLHTLSVSDSVKIFLKTGQYFILCKKKIFLVYIPSIF